jgi:hypothetical protein
MRDRVVEQFKAAFGPPTDPEQGRWSLLRGKHSPLNVIVNNPQSDVKATAGIGAARVGIGGAGAVGTGTGSAPTGAAPIEGVAGRRSIPQGFGFSIRMPTTPTRSHLSKSPRPSKSMR